MRQLTIRNLPPEIAAALAQERARRHGTLNETVIELLARALGVGERGGKRNGLAALAGTWTQDEYEQFNAAVAVTEQIDEDLWR